MADNGIADFIKQVGLANQSLKGNLNKSMGATYVKTTALQKAFGPLYDSFLKMTAVVDGLIGPFKALLVPFGLASKTADGIKFTFFGMIGILVAVSAGLATLAEKFGLNSEGTDKLQGNLGGLRDTLQEVWDKISQINFDAILESGSSVATEIINVWSSAMAEVVAVIDWVIQEFLELPATMEDLGFLDSFRDSFSGVFGAVEGLITSVEDALGTMGLEGQSASEIIIGFMESLGAKMVELGVDELINNIIDVMGEVIELVINLTTVFLDLAAEIIASDAFDVFLDIVEGALQLTMDAINGFFDFVGGFLETVNDLLTGEITLSEAFDRAIDAIYGLFEDLMDWLGGLDFGEILDDAMGSASGIVGAAVDWVSGSGGGVMTGPSTGYPAVLHGTEAVVPLPDGKSIPVSLDGGGGAGGGDATFNINVSGAKGDPESIAKAVGKEVQRVFKSRSRSGGYGRGI